MSYKFFYFLFFTLGVACVLCAQEVNVIDTSSSLSDVNLNNISVKQEEDTLKLKKSNEYYYDDEIQQILQSKLPKDYVIAGIEVSGTQYYNNETLASIAQLAIGQKVKLPGGDAFSKAIQHLWEQHLFEQINVYITKVVDRSIYLQIDVIEKPRLSSLVLTGIKTGEEEDIKEKIGSISKQIITNQMKRNIESAILKFFHEKGYLTVHTSFVETNDPRKQNMHILTVTIDKGPKNKIYDIVFFGNKIFTTYNLRGAFDETKILPRLTLFPSQDKFYYGVHQPYKFATYLKHADFLVPTKTLEFLDPYFRWNIFNGGKFDKEKYQEDKQNIIKLYNSSGYRDIKILKDTVYTNDFNKKLIIELEIKEGKKYYFGDIKFEGNTKYSDSVLYTILNIKKGDVYNIDQLNKKLGKQINPNGPGNDIGSLYQDDGYLFFNIETVESKIYNDTIDYILKIREGPQATIKKISIIGNEKTRDYVIRRELRTFPGEKFSRSDLMRSQRELANLAFFNPEKIGINPIPNIEEGTVDIDYTVEEKSADQIELQAGYSQYLGVTGTIGVTFNNFSIKGIFDKSSWSPLPSGDGQKLSLRFQTSGRSYYVFNASFTEPWFLKKRRTSLNVSSSYSFIGRTFNSSTGAFDFGYIDSSNFRSYSTSVSIGRQLKWPDDYFTLTAGLQYSLYNLTNYPLATDFKDGIANNLSLKITLSRNSIDNPLFTRSGSNFTLSGQFTLPYSLLNNKIDKFKFVEYHKWRLNAEWYFPLTPGLGVDKDRQLILKLAVRYGILGRYNSDADITPFERFQVGDAGLLNNFSFLAFDIISHRGYPVYSNSNPKINPAQNSAVERFTIFNKYIAELRYPISTSPTATIFVTTYFEAANGWYSLDEFNPLQLRRSVGVGARFFLPAFGLLGFDYAIGIDRLNQEGGIGGAGRFNFILGFEAD